MFLTETYVVYIGTHSDSRKTTSISHTWVNRVTSEIDICMDTWIAPLGINCLTQE
jgi:hypothetical protein